MSKFYFYMDANGQQQGPLPFSQLSPESITPTTMVWYEGLSQWQAASSLPDFYQFWDVGTPPPLVGSCTSSVCNNEIMPKTWLIESVLLMVFCCLPGGLVPLLYGSKVETLWIGGNKAEAKRYSQLAGTWVKWVLILTLVAVVLAFGASLFFPLLGLGFLTSHPFNMI